MRILLSLLVGALFLTTGCAASDRNTAYSRPQRSGLAVLEFVNTTPRSQADYFQPWEYGIAVMLSTDLEKTAMFNIVDRFRLNDILREQQLQVSGLVDSKTAVMIGQLVAAEYILTGSYMVVGRELKIMAQVFSVEKGIQLGAISAEGSAEDFFLVEKDLFANVAKALKVMLDDEQQARIMRTIETRSVAASLNNYSGEMAVMKSEEMKKLGRQEDADALRSDAIEKFRKALTYDPKYERARKNLSLLVMAIPMTL